MNIYKAFGLVIASEYILDELVVCQDEKADITIIKGLVPDSFENIIVENPNRKIGKDKFLLNVPMVSRYYVEKGRTIVIQPYPSASIEEIKLYLLGSSMGAILFQRKILPLHGSCINIHGKGVLLTGKSGAGKSTIAWAICNKGYKMITDDVAAIGVEGFKEPNVYSSYPGQKLWEDTIERIGRVEGKKTLNRLSRDMMKYSVGSNKYFCHEKTPIKVIIEIVVDNVETIKVEEIKSVEKLDMIMKNTYRPVMPKAMGLKDWHFKQCVAIANHVRAYRITRPLDQYLENDIASIILGKTI